MEILTKVWQWLLSDGSLYVAVAFAVSETLTAIPKLKANGVFQFVYNVLKWAKEKLVKNA